MARLTHADANRGEPEALAPAAVPELAELQQADPVGPAVPVTPDGPVEVHTLPARRGPAFSMTLSTTTQSVLSADLKRKRAVLVADGAWIYSHSSNGIGVTWPANVPLEITHADSVFATADPDEMPPVTLGVIVEIWAD